MIEFLRDLQQFQFLQNALWTGVLVSVACGIMGSYVTVRRIASMAGAIAHCTLGGMGAALFLQRELGLPFVTPLHGATAAALLAALVIGWVTLYARQREDSVLAAVWAIGMAIGIFFISRTRGYNQDLMSYLFGNILMVSSRDLLLIAGLDVLVVGLSILFYNRFLATCFDEEFARLRGIRTAFYFLLLLCLTALTIVLLVQIVGIVMVIALLTLPAATASHFTSRLWKMMILSSLLTVAYTTGGLALSYQPDLPAGATIVILAGVVYLLVLVGKAMRPRKTITRQPDPKSPAISHQP